MGKRPRQYSTTRVPRWVKGSPTKCNGCGKDPAEGLATIWSEKDGTLRYCHGDETDESGWTCYEKAVLGR